MKIVKTSKEARQEKMERKAANAGCAICPCCGERKTFEHYVKKGKLNKGILFGGLTRRWSTGIFRVRIMQADIYHCNTCGDVWESDPYEV